MFRETLVIQTLENNPANSEDTMFFQYLLSYYTCVWHAAAPHGEARGARALPANWAEPKADSPFKTGAVASAARGLAPRCLPARPQPRAAVTWARVRGTRGWALHGDALLYPLTGTRGGERAPQRLPAPARVSLVAASVSVPVWSHEVGHPRRSPVRSCRLHQSKAVRGKRGPRKDGPFWTAAPPPRREEGGSPLGGPNASAPLHQDASPRGEVQWGCRAVKNRDAWASRFKSLHREYLHASSCHLLFQ